MSNLWAKTKHEIVELLPPTIFFFCAFHLIAFVRVLMLSGTGIALQTSISVTIAALVVAKSVALADLLPVINLYPSRPLIYNVAWKTAIYFVAAGVIHYVERLIEFWREAGSFVAGNEKLLADMVWPHFWAIEIFLFVIILNYCVIRELDRALGEGVLRRMFFGPMAAAKEA